MLEGLKKFFTRKDGSKPGNQRNNENGFISENQKNNDNGSNSETLRKSEVEQQEEKNSGAERTCFTLMAEKCVPEEGDYFSVEGQLFGNAKEGEKVYALHRDGNISHLTLMKIEKSASFREQAKKEEQEETPETEGQRKVKLFFSRKEAFSPDWQYAVVTNIPYQIEANVNQAVENPYLLGLSCVFFERQGEGEFLNLFFRELVRSHYLVAIETDGGLPKEEEDGTVTLKAGMKITIPHVTMDRGESALPVFTDWLALGAMDQQMEAGWKRETMIAGFPQIVSMLTKGEGFVINPYGPQLFYVSPELIHNLMSSPGYQSEFGEAKVQSVEVKKDTEVLLGYPKKNEEVEALHRRLISFAKVHSEISMLDMLIKSDSDGTTSYLIIVDMPEEHCHECFKEIYESCRDLLHRVPYMDFVTLQRGDFAKGVRTEAPLYLRD
ncbi:enhanced serine sensitivity protein SseB C-terminal domain-containing protein [Oribacterium sinus]|uniref:enhanced serine sensitivity protein SseB C-terminal domain-containing protein n=1 Tax=Oribacterium sinus TaxID=237576 RepID=UPI0028D1FB9E|nr:enhanced serine sensitivity protein SseB C-terminal domain-containing protein [Oribacterium sinus]